MKLIIQSSFVKKMCAASFGGDSSVPNDLACLWTILLPPGHWKKNQRRITNSGSTQSVLVLQLRQLLSLLHRHLTLYRLSSYLGVVSRTDNLLKHQTIISTMRICLMSSVCVLTLKIYALKCYISLPRKSLKHHINIPRTALVPQETEESIIN